MKALMTMLLWASLCGNAAAGIQFVAFPTGGNFGANFPCTAQPVTAQAIVGVVTGLNCNVQTKTNFCNFMITEQPMEAKSVSKGFAFIEEVHRQYALQMDKNYVTKSQNIVEKGGLGKTLTYELTRRSQQYGYDISVKGLWFMYKDRLLRATSSCAPDGSKFMERERELFLMSLNIVR